MYFLPAKIGTFFPPQMVEPALHGRTLGSSELVREASSISSRIYLELLQLPWLCWTGEQTVTVLHVTAGFVVQCSIK